MPVPIAIPIPLPDRRPVPQGLIEQILVVYHEPCRFLKSAFIEYAAEHEDIRDDSALAIARGEFDVPSGWYIQDTGHFNAVDCLLCFNQIAYVTVAQGVADHRVDLGVASGTEFRERMLARTLIGRVALRFKRPLRSGRILGEFRLERMRAVAGRYVGKVSASFGAGETDTAMAEGMLVFDTP